MEDGSFVKLNRNRGKIEIAKKDFVIVFAIINIIFHKINIFLAIYAKIIPEKIKLEKQNRMNQIMFLFHACDPNATFGSTPLQKVDSVIRVHRNRYNRCEMFRYKLEQLVPELQNRNRTDEWERVGYEKNITVPGNTLD